MGKRTLVALLLIIANLSIFAQSNKLNQLDYSKPKTYEIGGITISGIKYLDHNALVHLSGLKVGETIEVPGDKITNAVTKLWKHGLFGDVKITATSITDDKIFLDIYLQERPRLSKFEFEGINKSQAEDLRDEVQLVRGTQVTDDMINVAKGQIKKYYIEKGFYNIDITTTQQEDSLMPNTVILTFNINKNSRVKIQEIQIDGNEVLTDNRLRRSMKDTKQKTWYNIFKSSKYIESKYKDDQNKLIAKYNEQGYRDAEIVWDTIYPISDKRLILKMKVQEGNQYFFRNVSWVGNTKYPAEYLNHQLGIAKGDVFDQAVLDKRLFGEENAVSALYLDRGYLFFNAIPVEVNVENDSIDLEIRIYEGEQARINKVTVTGNTRTNDHVIMREIWTKPGELFSRSDIIRTTRELANLGYFDAEKLDVKPVPNPADGTVDIEYIVEERPSDQIELSGGWGAGMVIGTLGLTFNNFSLRNITNFDTYTPLPSGDGQKLSLRGQTNGKYYQSYSLSFTEPWLGGKKPNSFTFSLYYTKRNESSYSYYSSNTSDDNMKIFGASVGLGRRLQWPDSYFTLYNELSYQRYILDNYNYFLITDGICNNLNFTTVLGRNSISQPLYPRSGSNISLSLQITPPYSLFKKDDFWELSYTEKKEIINESGGDEDTYTDAISDEENARHYQFIEYHKWKFKSEWYNQIIGDLVLRTNIEFGYLGSFNSNWGDSPFEYFEVGGDGMSGFSYYYGTDVIPVRGYENQSLSVDPQSNVYNKYTFELRYPITLNPSATIYALAFLEAANSWNKINEYSPFDVYRSAGVGVRFWLPMFGLIGVDWGYGFDDVPNNSGANGSQFGFTIGQQF